MTDEESFEALKEMEEFMIKVKKMFDEGLLSNSEVGVLIVSKHLLISKKNFDNKKLRDK
jgi:hypothetical protein